MPKELDVDQVRELNKACAKMDHLQAIVVKYLGPTSARGSRYKATAEAGSLTLDADHRLSVQANKFRAASLLALKYGWLDDGAWRLYSGGLPGQDGDSVYVMVRAPKPDDVRAALKEAMTGPTTGAMASILAERIAPLVVDMVQGSK